MARKTLLVFVLLVLAASVSGAAAGEGPPAGGFAALYEAEEAGVLRFDPLGTAGYVQDMDLRGGLLALLVLGAEGDGNGSLVLYDLFEGKQTARRALDGDSYALELSLLEDGRVCVLDWQTLETTFYDGSLQPLALHPGAAAEGYCCPLLSPDGKMLFGISADWKRIAGFPLEGGPGFTHENPLAKGWSFSEILGCEDGKLLYTLTDASGRSLLNAVGLGDGRTQAHAVPPGFYRLSGSLLYASSSGGAYWFMDPREGPGIVSFGAWPDGAYPVAAQGPLVAAWRGSGDNVLQLFDLKGGLLIASGKGFEGDGDGYLQQVLLSEKGFAVVRAGDELADRPAFYLWDYGAPPDNADAAPRRTTLEAVQAENSLLARVIGEDSGIRVYLGVSGNDFSDGTYMAGQAEDLLLINAALKELRAFCSGFPEGMLREICVPPVTRIGVYLCGAISPISSEGIHSPMGFSSVDGTERCIAVSLYEAGKLTQNLAHEFMHAMEDRLWQRGYRPETGSHLVRDWERFVPPGLPGAGYAFSYHDAEGYEYSDVAFTADDPAAAEDPELILYVDAYSKTYPLEDRARIFEHLFASGDSLPDCFASSRLKLKAQYLCAVIRACFDAAAVEGPLRWERQLPLLPVEAFGPFLESAGGPPAGE